MVTDGVEVYRIILARPAKLKPATLEAMPEVADGGRTYTLRIRKGAPQVQLHAAGLDARVAQASHLREGYKYVDIDLSRRARNAD